MANLPPLRPHPHLYEINTWVWLEELSRRAGSRVTLAEVPDREWDRLRERGFDLVWLMGVWRRSPEARRIAQTDATLFAGYAEALPGWQEEDVVGSPYAVQAYEPDPRIGSWADLDRVRASLHRRGLRLVLDLVPNHTARDHPWVTAHPEYYVLGDERSLHEHPTAFFLPPGGERRPVAHGRDPYFPPWTDTAQLNYLNPAMREAMVGELRRLAGHCDGLRCDMAMLALTRIFMGTWGHRVAHVTAPPREFWAEAREAVPGLLLIAEVYWDLEWELQQLGFDFAYDKRLYDRLRAGNARDVAAHLGADVEYQCRLVRFLENHDEPRSAQVFGDERIATAATLIATLPGMRFYHQGQLEGRRRRPPVQLARSADEPPDARLLQLYDSLLHLSAADVFHRGKWRLLSVTGEGDGTQENLVAYDWRIRDTWHVVIVNLSAAPACGRLHLPEDGGEGPRSVSASRLVDARTGSVRLLDGAQSTARVAPIRLKPYGVELLSVIP